MMYAKLLNEQDINRIKDKFYEDINHSLEEAKRKHVSSSYYRFTHLAQYYARSNTNLAVCAAGLLCLR